MVRVNLTQHWPNYVLPVRTADRVNRGLIVDTGNAQLTFLSRNFPYNNKTMKLLDPSPCLVLQEDFTIIEFVSNRKTLVRTGLCTQYRSRVSIGSVESTVNFTVATNITVENKRLHPWVSPAVDGDIGLAYCNSVTGSCGSGQVGSAFFQLMANLTDTPASWPLSAGNATSAAHHGNKIFGLDFAAKPLSNGVSGSLTLGGVLPQYSQDLVWARQPTDTPTYHEAFLTNLALCGVSLLQGQSVSSWPMLVDTGVACVALPAEIYDAFVAWADLSPVPDTSNMPALSFGLEGGQAQSGTSTLYVPLSSLLVNASLFQTESGAPEVVVGGVKQKLCILRGDSASGNPAPRITLGTLALHSLYFAADVTTGKLGLAPKIGADALMDHLNNDWRRCKAAAPCIGQQQFTASSNTCSAPDCSSYFFTSTDPRTQTCVYSGGALGFGLFLVVLAVLLESVTFFVTQYSALEILHARERHSLAISKVDFVTRAVGKRLTAGVDWLVVASAKVWGMTAGAGAGAGAGIMRAARAE